MVKMYKHTAYATETNHSTHVYAQDQVYVCFSADFFIPPHMKGLAHSTLIKAMEKLAACK